MSHHAPNWVIASICGLVLLTPSVLPQEGAATPDASSGIWRMPLNGGEEIRVLDRPDGEDWWNWALVEKGIYFLDSMRRTVGWDANPRPATVKFFDFATGRETSIFTLDRPWAFRLAVAPDGSSILYSEREIAESTIMLVKNFR